MDYCKVYRKPDGLCVLITPSTLSEYVELGFTTEPPPWENKTPADSAAEVVAVETAEGITSANVEVQEIPVDNEVVTSPLAFKEFSVTVDSWTHKPSANRYITELEHWLNTKAVQVTVESYEGTTTAPIIRMRALSLSKVAVEVAAVPDMRFTGVLRVSTAG